MKTKFILLGLGLFSIIAVAQENPAVDDLYELSLEELLNIPITTATKTSGKLDYAPSVIDVVTGDQIRQRGYQNLGQLLNDIANNHQDRSNWGIGEPTHQNVGFGFRFDTGQNMLILFNGQRLNAFLPGNRFGGEEYLLSTIDRIEIIRGPGSALYGTGAFTCVINIISKKVSDASDEYAQAEYDYIPTSKGHSVSAGFGLQAGKNGSLTGSFRQFNEDGQSLNVMNALFGNQQLKDGVSATDGELVFAQGKFNLFSKITNQKRNTVTGFNGVNPTHLKELQLSMYAYSVGTDYTFDIGEKTNIKLSAGWHQDNWTEVALIPQFKLNAEGTALQLDENGYPILDTLDLFRKGEFIETSFFIDGQGADTRSLDGEIQFTSNYRKNNYLVFGIYVADDRVLNAFRPSELNLNPLMFVPFSVIDDQANNWLFDVNASRKTLAPFVQMDYSIAENLTASGGVRVDNYWGTGALKTQKYSEWNPRASLVYTTENIGTFKALFGTATRIPNGFETLSSVSILGDPTNRAERIKTYQLQWINNWSGGFRTEFGFFRSEISNRLETNATISDELKAQGFVGQFINVGGDIVQQNNGLDLKLVAKTSSNSTLIINATQYFGSDDGNGNPLAYIPNTMINADYSVIAGWFNINAGLNFRSRFTKAVSDVRDPVNQYLIARLNIIMTAPSSPFQLKLTARNLFNTEYYYPSSSQDFINHFPARGLELVCGVIYRPSFQKE
jgi:outer membrane receptor for ferrienterochelin and colicins